MYLIVKGVFYQTEEISGKETRWTISLRAISSWLETLFFFGGGSLEDSAL